MTFYVSDFATDFATSGVRYILSRCKVACSDVGIKFTAYFLKKIKSDEGVENSMTDNKNVMTGKIVDDSRMAGHTDATVDAHAKHTLAIMNAQKEKNETNAAAHALNKDSGMGSHKVSYDAKTGVHKAGSDDAMADAHNPHKHAGIEAYKVSHDAKTGDHNVDTQDATVNAHAKHTQAMMNSQKEKNETNATAHTLHQDAETKTRIVTGDHKKPAVHKASSAKIATHVPRSPSKK
jgi:hypothetical protein